MGISAELGLIPEPTSWQKKNNPVTVPKTPVNHPCATDFKHRDPMHISPSQSKSTGPVEKMAELGEHFKVTESDVTKYGTCVHQIYCVLDRYHSSDYVERLISSYGVKADASDIMEVWDKFVNFMTETYGEAEKVDHEMAFKYGLDGQIVTGSIDYVWHTRTGGSVLVDYKTFPGQISDALNVSNAHYAGHYKGQLDCYTTALERAGRKVIDRLIFYPTLGLVVRVK